MFEVRQTRVFEQWLTKLRDRNAKFRILTRLRRLELGNPGDWKAIGGGVNEMRIDYGPGYRLYYSQQGNTIIVMLCGGDKGSQKFDIDRAMKMARELGYDD